MSLRSNRSNLPLGSIPREEERQKFVMGSPSQHLLGDLERNE